MTRPSPRPIRTALARVPTALFPMALGLAGLGASARAGAAALDAPWLAGIGAAVLVAAGVIYLADIVLYAAKLVAARGAARMDLGDPTTANLLAPAFMAGMVLGAQAAAVAALGAWLWIAAATGHAFLLLRFVGRWVTRAYPPDALNPTWFLPAAGIMTGAMTAGGFWPDPLSWAMFAAGFGLWIALSPLMLRRVVFEPALAPRLRPTLFILAAPPGLAANALLNLSPGLAEAGPASLAWFGAFWLAAMVMRPRFLLEAGVSLSWWATTFPTATVATAFFGLHARGGEPIYAAVGGVLLAFTVGFVALALVATARVGWRTCLGAIEEMEDDLAALQGDADHAPRRDPARRS